MNSIKVKRYSNAFAIEISNILRTEIKDETLKFVTITGCEITSDLSYAKVYFTSFEGNVNEITVALNNAASFIRGELSQRIEIRHTPELRFIYDSSIEYGKRIETIIDKINSKE